MIQISHKKQPKRPPEWDKSDRITAKNAENAKGEGGANTVMDTEIQK